MYTMILFGILCLIFAFWVKRKIGEIGNYFGYIMGSVMVTLAFFIIFMFISIPFVDYKWHEISRDELVAMNDHFTVGGSFFLGSGNISEKTYYVSYIKTGENSFILDKTDTNKSIVIYSDESPVKITYEKRAKHKWQKRWLICVQSGRNYYEFKVPKGSIMNNIALDLK